jgi:hypothetical protein
MFVELNSIKPVFDTKQFLLACTIWNMQSKQGGRFGKVPPFFCCKCALHDCKLRGFLTIRFFVL